MKALKTIANVCLAIIVVIAICVIIAFVYYHYFVKDITIGVNNIDNQVGLDVDSIKNSEDLTEEEKEELNDRYFLEVNYYSNDKGNGIELQELQLNYFTTPNLSVDDYWSTGMQYLGNYQGLPLDTWDGESKGHFMKLFGNNDSHYGIDEVSVNIANNYVDTSFNYYDYTVGVHWDGVTDENGSIATVLTRKTPFIVKINNRPYMLRLDKYFDKDVGDWRNGFGVKVGEKYNRFYYTYGSLFQSCLQAVKTNSKGTGDYYIVPNLSSLFSIYEYDEETKKFKTDDVSDIVQTYCVMKFHYDENGARSVKHSLFEIIDGNPNYGLRDGTVGTTYWQERVLYNLDVNSKLNGKDVFEYRYSDIYKGYFVSLSMDCKELFAEMSRAKVNITLDLTAPYLADKQLNVVGLDYNAFDGFRIDTLTVQGNEQTFYLLEKSLYDTQLQVLKYSKSLTLDFGNEVINSEYKGVEL